MCVSRPIHYFVVLFVVSLLGGAIGERWNTIMEENQRLNDSWREEITRQELEWTNAFTHERKDWKLTNDRAWEERLEKAKRRCTLSMVKKANLLETMRREKAELLKTRNLRIEGDEANERALQELNMKRT